MMDDQYKLQRFLDAQAAVIETVRAELSNGQKRSHWMWFIFPQVAGLGSSEMSRRFAISGREEAEAYVGHAVLGERLRTCTNLVNQLQGRSAYQIFGEPDCMKFQSSMTLFAEAGPDRSEFQQALAKYFDGEPDRKTLAILGREPRARG